MDDDTKRKILERLDEIRTMVLVDDKTLTTYVITMFGVTTKEAQRRS